MLLKIRLNYLRFLLPATALTLLLCLLCLTFSGFGFLYILKSPQDAWAAYQSGNFEGSLVQIDANQISGTFARFGPEALEGQTPDFVERYCVLDIGDGFFMAIRINEARHKDQIDKITSALQSPDSSSLPTLNLGTFTGTVSRMDDSTFGYLRKWVGESRAGRPAEYYNPTDEEIAETEAFLDAYVLPYILNTDFLGAYPDTSVYPLSVLAAFFLLLALALAATDFAGIWDKEARKLIAKDENAAKSDFDGALIFGKSLRAGKKYIWFFGLMKTRIAETSDIVWVYPRSKRLEGGKFAWRLVVKTRDKREFTAKLPSAAIANDAAAAIAKLVPSAAIGFDQKKQELFDSNISAFLKQAKQDKQN